MLPQLNFTGSAVWDRGKDLTMGQVGPPTHESSPGPAPQKPKANQGP